MRQSARPVLALIVCSLALTACADENGSSATSPPIANATGTHPPVAAATVAPGNPTYSGAAATCPPITPSGPQDTLATRVTLTTAADGLQSGDITVGSGAAVVAHQNVTVNYTGWLPDGQVFDTSRKAGAVPASFSLDGVIPGWTEGVVGMKPGGKRRLVIPGPLAYGANGQGCIPANATLTFDIQLISAK